MLSSLLDRINNSSSLDCCVPNLDVIVVIIIGVVVVTGENSSCVFFKFGNEIDCHKDECVWLVLAIVIAIVIVIAIAAATVAALIYCGNDRHGKTIINCSVVVVVVAATIEYAGPH